jgi:glycosyltransferase involved in cell wall biosynthesis
LAACPSVLYFHENQFAYPRSIKQQDIVSAQITSVYSALASDKILFNSEYNRHSFFDGALSLLKKMPDHLNAAKVYERLAQRSEVLPVPVQMPQISSLKPTAKDNAVPELIWNHRWEYDKCPDRLLLLVEELLKRDMAFTLHIVGQQFRQRPKEMEVIAQKLGSRLGRFGYIPDTTEYQQLLARCDFVLSTALHDFQGLSVLEAVAAGCQPLLPNRVAYTEQYPTAFLYKSLIDSPAKEARSAADLIERLINADKADYKPPRISAFSSEKLIPKYRACFESVRMSRPSH